MLSAKHIAKEYSTGVVLSDVCCDIPAGKISAIIGRSGCGKTTLLRHLAFLESPDSGEVTVDIIGSHFTSKCGPTPWPQVTCVFQKQFLWPHLSLRENILLPLRSTGKRVDNRIFEDLVKMFDMAPFIDRFPDEVSGGEAQRVALARAFALKSKYILLDEAHTFLDMEQQQVLNAYLLKLRNAGIGLAVVTHSLSFVKAHADQIIVVENGRIVESGGPDIIDNPSSDFLMKIKLLSI